MRSCLFHTRHYILMRKDFQKITPKPRPIRRCARINETGTLLCLVYETHEMNVRDKKNDQTKLDKYKIHVNSGE